jgi:hypothetical protein
MASFIRRICGTMECFKQSGSRLSATYGSLRSMLRLVYEVFIMFGTLEVFGIFTASQERCFVGGSRVMLLFRPEPDYK